MRISDWSSDVCSSDLIPRSLKQPNSRRCRKQLAWAGPTSLPAAMPLLPTANSKVSLHSWDSRRRLPSLTAARLSPADSWDSQPSRSEELTSELQSLMRISSAVFCLNQNKTFPVISKGDVH